MQAVVVSNCIAQIDDVAVIDVVVIDSHVEFAQSVVRFDQMRHIANASRW